MPTYRLLPIENCTIDERYQRDVIEPHVERIRREFDESKFQVLEASERKGGEFAIFDGQQRLTGVRRRVEQDERPVFGSTNGVKLPALVHTGLTPREEADLFLELQSPLRRRQITPINKFRTRVFAEDPIAVGIKAILDKFGYQINTGVAKGVVGGVVAVERAYRRGNLSETLSVNEIWKGDESYLAADIIDGLSRFLDLYREADLGHAKSKWSEVSPKVILRRAGDVYSTSRASGVLIILREEYIDRSHRLPTVEEAIRARVVAEGGGRRRYIRVSPEQVLDAALELEQFQLADIREKLGGVSKAALTNQKTGLLHKLWKSGTLRRRYANSELGEDPSKGYVYFVVAVSDQAASREIRRRAREGRKGRAAIRTALDGAKTKRTGVKKGVRINPDIRSMIDEIKDGGVEVNQTAAGNFVAVKDGKRVTIKGNPGNQRGVMEERSKARRAGLPV